MPNDHINDAIGSAIERQIRDVEEFIADMRGSTNDGFCPVSLGDWLRLCADVGVPAVPAEQIAAMNKDDYLDFDQPTDEQRARLDAVLDAVEQSAEQGYMVRYDACSCLTIKSELSRGRAQWQEVFGCLTLDDPRAFDILMEYPREEIPIWKRPWVDALLYDGYPVEYRAFVLNGELVGISNYYPQRPLLPDATAGDVVEVRRLTERLISGAAPVKERCH